MRAIAKRRACEAPPTIEDPAALEEIERALGATPAEP
jgi:hypothetical protein